MPTPRPIIGTRISVIVLKWVSRAARNRIRNAPITATIANESGITVGTSARNSTIRMKKAATRPMMSLRPCVGGALSASPVNSIWMPAGSPIARSWSSSATMSARSSWNPVLSYCTSKNATRPSPESWPDPGASGLVISATSFGSSASACCDACPATSIFLIAAESRSRVEPAPVLGREHHPQGGALVATELRLDQVGRLLRVRARDLEVVDQLAVERRVQPDQEDEHDRPAPDHPPRVARTTAGKPRQRPRVRDQLVLYERRVVEITLGHA